MYFLGWKLHPSTRSLWTHPTVYERTSTGQLLKLPANASITRGTSMRTRLNTRIWSAPPSYVRDFASFGLGVSFSCSVILTALLITAKLLLNKPFLCGEHPLSGTRPALLQVLPLGALEASSGATKWSYSLQRAGKR